MLLLFQTNSVYYNNFKVSVSKSIFCILIIIQKTSLVSHEANLIFHIAYQLEIKTFKQSKNLKFEGGHKKGLHLLYAHENI